ncbi:MAG: N-acetylglucosamine-6-phosphate deacetylase [Chloroflexi bacterium OHK40]
MRFVLNNCRLIDATGTRPGPLLVDAGRIAAIGGIYEVPALDLGGALVAPGFVDVHTHGGGGYSLHTEHPDEIRAYAAWAPSTGVTAFLAGIVGVPGGLPETQIRAALAAATGPAAGAELAGMHLEGPYINVARRGAHAPEWLRVPDPAETERLLELAGSHLRIITVAPELPGAKAMIRRLVAAGVTVSLGHTDATYEQTRAAIPLGLTHATHCFNAMRPLHHREPGPLGAIVEDARVSGELIADGVHVHPAALRLLLRALGPDRVIVVTDALSCAGLRDAVFSFGGQPARVVDGVARLADGTLTGSVLTMDRALRNLVGMLALPLSDALAALSANPARAAGLAHRKGLLRAGYDADLIVLDETLTLQATFCRGILAYAAEAFRRRHPQLQIAPG